MSETVKTRHLSIKKSPKGTEFMGKLRKTKLLLPPVQVETDLDLAPLLSIMVKLIPITLLSSVFVHVVVLNSELPSWMKSVSAEKSKNNQIELYASKKNGFQVLVKNHSKVIKEYSIPLDTHNGLDYKKLNQILVKVKEENPDVFTLLFYPEAEISYEEVIKIMDFSRKPIDKTVRFVVRNSETQALEDTDFMFPDIHFANLF